MGARRSWSFLWLCVSIVACGPGDDGGAGTEGGATGASSSTDADASTRGPVSASGELTATGTSAASTGGPDDSTGAGSTGVVDPDTGTGTTGEPSDAAMVLYVNFDGAELGEGPDDAPAGTTQISQMATMLQPFGEGPKRDAAFASVVEHWAPYHVLVTDAPPASGPYTMAVVTPTNPFGGGVQGIAPLDCGDTMPSNVVFAFGSEAGPQASEPIASTISREVGFAVGLERVDAPGDIMHVLGSDAPAAFTDACAPLEVAAGMQCANPPAPGCGNGTQNAHAYLLDLFGAAP